MMHSIRILFSAIVALMWLLTSNAQAISGRAKSEFPKTDFSMASVDLREIISGGPGRDGIPPIDNPRFGPVAAIRDVSDQEPVISISMGGQARAYPFRILIWHEIVNDEVEGLPVAVTFCPLCNAAVIFSRRVEGRVLDFGTTGRLRKSDLVMYDRQTESWWQQFTGQAIVGQLTGTELERIPARIEAFGLFKERHPNGLVLLPDSSRKRPYGLNPYVGYDSLRQPFLYRGDLPDNLPALARVVSVGDRAWSLSYIRDKGPVETKDGLIISWRSGQASALDDQRIEDGRDVGNVLVQRRISSNPGPHGEPILEDVVYGVDFAFAFHAFYPEVAIITSD